jgi:carbon starvation protein
MIDRESDIRPIGYGAMLLEGLVGVVALIAAASMPPSLYYDINVDVEKIPTFEKQLQEMKVRLEGSPESQDQMHQTNVRDVHQLDIGKAEEMVGGESLRGRTGGAVTLAVSMATILTDAFNFLDGKLKEWMMYWYHFAIMFEALFILTTIDAGTRIARYLFQETLGKLHPNFARTDWLPGALLATGLVTAGWGILVATGEIMTIWPMFGIANQLLAVMAMALVTTWLINSGRGRYAWVTVLPMIFVTATTLTAGKIMVTRQLDAIQSKTNVGVNTLNMVLTLFVITTVCSLVLIALTRWLTPKRV